MPPVRAIKRTLLAFYDDQMTHHAAALTYYVLMSLFPAALLGLSLLGLLGQYPETYDAILNYLEDVAPASLIDPLDRSLRKAFLSKGTATTTLVVSTLLTLYGTTGALEAARRALNVVFELEGSGRSFLRRKAIDIVSTFVLLILVLSSLVLVFVGGRSPRTCSAFSAWARRCPRSGTSPAGPGLSRGDLGLRLHLLRDSRRQAAGVPLAHSRSR